jgi:hypothetical protein
MNRWFQYQTVPLSPGSATTGPTQLAAMGGLGQRARLEPYPKR